MKILKFSIIVFNKYITFLTNKQYNIDDVVYFTK